MRWAITFTNKQTNPYGYATQQGAFGEFFSDAAAHIMGMGSLGQEPEEWKTNKLWPAMAPLLSDLLGDFDRGVRNPLIAPSLEELSGLEQAERHEASQIYTHVFFSALQEKLSTTSSTAAEIKHVQENAFRWLTRCASFADGTQTPGSIFGAMLLADREGDSSFQVGSTFQKIMAEYGAAGDTVVAQANQWLRNR